MKKVKLTMMTLMMCLMTSVVFGQWTYKTINSKSDGSFKKAYTKTNNRGYLVMEVGDSAYNDTIKSNIPFLSLWGSSFCDASYIDFVLVVNGENKKYKLTGRAFDNSVYYFDESMWTDEFIKDFKSASKCFIRVQYQWCDYHYQFDFSGSAAAYDFITK